MLKASTCMKQRVEAFELRGSVESSDIGWNLRRHILGELILEKNF